MKTIEKLIDQIEEEIEGAREYAEKYVECRARGNSTRAAKYKEMAHDELKHANTVYEFAEADVDAIRKVYPISVEDEEKWAHAVKKMHHCVAEIMMYLG